MMACDRWLEAINQLYGLTGPPGLKLVNADMCFPKLARSRWTGCVAVPPWSVS